MRRCTTALLLVANSCCPAASYGQDRDSCAAFLARLADAPPGSGKSYSTIEVQGTPALEILEKIRTADARRVVLSHPDALVDVGVLRALASSDARLVLQTTHGYQRTRALLEVEVEGIELLAVLPRDLTATKLVFGSGALGDEQIRGKMDTVAAKVEGAHGEVISSPNDGRTIRDLVRSRIASGDPRSAIVILVPVENDVLILPDGSSLETSGLFRTSVHRNRPIIVVAANTIRRAVDRDSVTTVRDLNFDHIASSLVRLRVRMETGETLKHGELLSELITEHRKQEEKGRLKTLVVLGASGGAVLSATIAVLTIADDGRE